MDNGGDWLYYIVFLIIAGISGLMSSKNKKKDRPDILGQPGREIVPNEEPTQEKGFWEILEEMGNPQPEPQPQPQPQRKPKKQKAENPMRLSTQPPKPFLTAERDIPSRIASQPSAMTQDEEETSLFSTSSLQDMDEIKKAVIYAEILNRKYV